jgi:aryl-alcohol dehydrogenase-like predicted oxidoreductase
MLPIPGTGSLAHLAENAGAASVQLTPQDIASLAG